MRHSCLKARKSMARQLDRASAPVDPGLSAHLSACGKCAVEFDGLKRLGSSMRRMGTHRAPPGFSGRVMRRVRALKNPGKETPWQRLMAFVSYDGAAVFALALVIGIASGNLILSRVFNEAGPFIAQAGEEISLQNISADTFDLPPADIGDK